MTNLIEMFLQGEVAISELNQHQCLPALNLHGVLSES